MPSNENDSCLKKTLRRQGLGYITPLKIKKDFLKPFPVFWNIFFHTIMDKSAEKSIKDYGKHNAEARRYFGTQVTVDQFLCNVGMMQAMSHA